MNALRNGSTSFPTLVKQSPRLHLVPVAPLPVEPPQSCALVDLIRINRLDAVLIADDLRRIACALFVPAFCVTQFWYELLGIES